LFNDVLDQQLTYFTDRFTEVTTALLRFASCFDPANDFSSWNNENLALLAGYYPQDFNDTDLRIIQDELPLCLRDIKEHASFRDLSTAAELARTLVRTRKHLVYPLVYHLLCLTLVMPVSTASAERSFSSMNLVKSAIRNTMADEWMQALLIIPSEWDIADAISDAQIMEQYQKVAPRRARID
jgi:hypothetical protein